MNFLSFQKWLYSKKNMTGISCSVVAMILYVTGIIDDLWLPIVIGSYALGYMAAPKEETAMFYHFKGESLKDYIGFLERLKKTCSSKLPQAGIVLFDEIHENANELINFLENSPQSLSNLNEDILTIRKIFDNYLPKLVNQYVLLPTKYAENIITNSGKTSQQMLIEQLTILNEQVKKIAYATYENDVNALRAHGKFLETKFNQKELFVIEKSMNY